MLLYGKEKKTLLPVYCMLKERERKVDLFVVGCHGNQYYCEL